MAKVKQSPLKSDGSGNWRRKRDAMFRRSRQNVICWEKSGNTALLTSCLSLYPYHSRLATSNSAGLAAFEDGVTYRCYRQMRNSEFSEGRMEIHDENRSGRPSVSDGVVEKVETILLEDFLPHGTTVNFDRYCDTLRKLRRAIQNRRRGRLSRGEHLGGQRFSTDDEVKEEVTRFLKGLAAEFYNMGIEKLEHLLQKCLDRNDVYMTTVGVSAHATMLDVSPVYGSVTTVFSVTFTSTRVSFHVL
ncbi:hypothetical protein J6590_086598 [Homalodisca vitripennis]|nr:hypothetical protein J6590_086598 [Homalodisca vitripennis]